MQLQFEVFGHRLASEFNAPAEILSAGYQAIRRTDPRSAPRLREIGGIRILHRSDGALVALFENRYRLARLEADEPELTLEPLVAGAIPASESSLSRSCVVTSGDAGPTVFVGRRW